MDSVLRRGSSLDTCWASAKLGFSASSSIGRGDAADSELGRAIQEASAVDAAVDVLVEEVQQLLIEVAGLLALHGGASSGGAYRGSAARCNPVPRRRSKAAEYLPRFNPPSACIRLTAARGGSLEARQSIRDSYRRGHDDTCVPSDVFGYGCGDGGVDHHGASGACRSDSGAVQARAAEIGRGVVLTPRVPAGSGAGNVEGIGREVT